MPFGSLAGCAACLATSLMVSVWLVLGDEKMPSVKLTSSCATLSIWAAIALALATIFSVATWKAEPARVAEREPPVPSPKNTRSVSPWMYWVSAGSRPRRSHTNCLNTVSWPCPWVTLPENKVASPARSKRISAPSKLGAPARSMVLESPNPRSLPRFFASARRAAKPLASASASAMSMFFSNSPLS